MKKIEHPALYAKTAVAAYETVYGNDLKAIILYGSAAGGDFDAARSDINLLIILTSMDPELIAKSATVQKQLLKKRFSRPLFMDQKYIATSLDSYPMEFLDMKGCNVVLFGEDVLCTITPDTKDLRLQVERELKGKWLHLLQEYSGLQKKSTHLAALATLSLKAFLPTFRTLLFLKGVAIPADRKSVLSAVEKAYSLTGQPLQNAALQQTTPGISPETFFLAYIKSIATIISIVDND